MRTREHRAEHGFTMIELLIVMTMMGVVSAMMVNAYVAAARATTTGAARAEGLEDIRPAIQRMTRELRAADPIVLSSTNDFDTELGAIISRGGNTFRHNYEVRDDSGDGDFELWEGVVQLNPDGSETFVRDFELVLLVDNGTLNPVFRYFDDYGAEITCDDLDLSVSADATQCASRLVTASQIGLSVTRYIVGSSTPLTIETAVNIRNMRYSS